MELKRLRFARLEDNDKAGKRAAMQLIVEHHYLHRRCHCKWCFIVKDGDKTKGVMTVGKSQSETMRCGVVGEKMSDVRAKRGRHTSVYELNRLWCTDDLPKYTESRFLGWCLRELRKLRPDLILVSYADLEEGHSGTIYQATNWIYCGLNSDIKNPSLKHRFVWFANKEDERLLAWKRRPYDKSMWSSFDPA